jgi:hypothetical protein
MQWLERIEDEGERSSDDAESEFDRENELIPLIKRATYSFDGRTSSTQTLVLADGVDATRMRVGGLVMLVHNRTGWGATADLLILVNNVSFSPDEPDVAYVDGSRNVGNSTLIQQTLPVVPFYEVVGLTPPLGPQLRISLRFRQGLVQAAAAQSITLSLYLTSRTRL